jgi:hypothetical protein
MTIEGIIRMAKQAGFADEEIDICQQILIHFATLVAQQEREECAKVCETFDQREAFNDEDMAVADACATAIRARGSNAEKN